jgi:Zn-dependent protease with chaperone function
MTPLVLGVLAVALAGPVPALLARVAPLRRTPAAAMLLWQGVALAAVLSAVGAGLAVVTTRPWRGTWGEALLAGAALVVTVVVVGRLLLSAHLVGTELRRLRRHHREAVDLLARRDPRHDPRHGSRRGQGMSILDHDLPVAYCVPGMAAPRIVVSDAALERLAPDELDAVVAHERAHLRARHDLVLEAFTVLHRAFPRFVASDAALREVELLVEVLADRAALRAASPRSLGNALLALAGGRAPAATIGAAASSLVLRVQLLRDARPRPLQAGGLVAAALLLLVVPTVFVVLPWLTALP